MRDVKNKKKKKRKEKKEEEEEERKKEDVEVCSLDGKKNGCPV